MCQKKNNFLYWQILYYSYISSFQLLQKLQRERLISKAERRDFATSKFL